MPHYIGVGKRELVTRRASSGFVLYLYTECAPTEIMTRPVLFYRVALCVLALPSLVKGNRAGHTIGAYVDGYVCAAAVRIQLLYYACIRTPFSIQSSLLLLTADGMVVASYSWGASLY